MKVAEFNLSCQYDNEQYWQGHGISLTKWDDCGTGCGSSPQDALDDCLDGLAQLSIKFTDEQLAEMEAIIGNEGAIPVESDDCYYYVSIDVLFEDLD